MFQKPIGIPRHAAGPHTRLWQSPAPLAAVTCFRHKERGKGRAKGLSQISLSFLKGFFGSSSQELPLTFC